MIRCHVPLPLVRCSVFVLLACGLAVTPVVACSNSAGVASEPAEGGGAEGGDGSNGSGEGGDGSSGDTDGGDASSHCRSSTAGPHPCATPPGDYLEHFTKDPSSSLECLDMGENSVFVSGCFAPNLDMADEDFDAGPACSVTEDMATCTLTIHCAFITGDGGTTTLDQTQKNSSGSISGTVENKASDDAGAADCKYTYKWTKQ